MTGDGAGDAPAPDDEPPSRDPDARSQRRPPDAASLGGRSRDQDARSPHGHPDTATTGGLLGDLARFARREPGLALLFVLASAVNISPLWVGRYVPLLDYANHLSNVFVWFHLHDPAWNFERYYATSLAPVPYWAQYGTVYLLGCVVGVELAHKLFLTVAILALPPAVAAYARQVGRDPRLALFAFPLTWNFNLGQGFIAYCAGLPALFLALAALDRAAERPSRARAAGAALLGASLYFFHILVWGAYLAIGGASALLAPRRLRLGSSLRAVLPTLPALAVGLLAYRVSDTMQVKVRPGKTGLASFVGLYYDLRGVLESLPGWLIDLVPGPTDELALVVLAGSWLLLITTRPLAGDDDGAGARGGDRDSAPRTWRVEVAALFAFLLCVLLPRSLIHPFYWYAVSRRIGVILALFCALLPRGRVTGARRAILSAVAVVALAYPLDLAVHFHRWNARTVEYEQVMEGIPRGKQVLPLMFRKGAPEVNVSCWNQWGSWVQLRQGGFMLYNFDGDFPLRYRRKLPSPPWDAPTEFRFELHGEPWDYFLLYGRGAIDVFRGAHSRVRLHRRAGDWELWEKLPPID